MNDETPYDWKRHAPLDGSDPWSESGVWFDIDGSLIEIGMTVELMQSAVAFNEKGGNVGIWEAGRFEKVTAASMKYNVVYFEGGIGFGWAAGALPADRVRASSNAKA